MLYTQSFPELRYSPGIGIVVFLFLIISFLLFYGSARLFERSTNKKVTGIVDNISLRNIQKRRWWNRGAPMGTVQVLSFRIIVPMKDKETVFLPGVYEYSGLNLKRGDTVEAYGYTRDSELKVKKLLILD